MDLPTIATPFSSFKVAVMDLVASVVLYETLGTVKEVIDLRTVTDPVAEISLYSLSPSNLINMS